MLLLESIIEVNLELRPALYPVQTIALNIQGTCILILPADVTRREADDLNLDRDIFPVSLLKAFQACVNIVYQPSRKHIQHIDRINRIFHIYYALGSFLNGLSHVHTKLLNELNNGVEVDGNTHLQGGETF